MDKVIRDEAIIQLLKGAGNSYSFESVSNGLDEQGWIVHPVFFNSMVIGAIIQNGANIHTSIAPEFQKKWNPRPYIRKILYPALEKYGEIYSEAKKHDLRAIRWLKKLGFSEIKEDDNLLYFQLKEIKFNK